LEASSNANNNSTQPPSASQSDRNLRMKYYRSLGVNGVTVPSSLPNNSGAQLMNERFRTKTTPTLNSKVSTYCTYEILRRIQYLWNFF
jgi:hypothetical protein